MSAVSLAAPSLLSSAQLISDLVAGQSLWAVLAIFCGLVLVGTTFISHTVGAMVILPIVQSVGQAMPGPDHSKLLVMGAALMCSGAAGCDAEDVGGWRALGLHRASCGGGVLIVWTGGWPVRMLASSKRLLPCALSRTHSLCLSHTHKHMHSFSSHSHALALLATHSAGAMGLPVSGFPNMNAVALEDPTGSNYVDTSDFLKVGLLGSVMAYGIIISVGYGLMMAVGF